MNISRRRSGLCCGRLRPRGVILCLRFAPVRKGAAAIGVPISSPLCRRFLFLCDGHRIVCVEDFGDVCPNVKKNVLSEEKDDAM